MQVKTLKRYGIQVFFLFPFVLLLWWYILPIIILPSIEYSAGYMLEQFFSHERVDISTTEDKKWMIDTYFLIEEKPYSRTWSTSLDIVLFSFGLPLFWCICLAFLPIVQWGKILIGTIILLVSIYICTFFKGFMVIATLMADEGVKYLYTTQRLYEAVVPFSDVVMLIMEFIASLSVYSVTIIIPFMLGYYINRSNIEAIFLTSLTKK